MKLILRDRNPEMMEAWKVHFKNLSDVEIGCGDIFDVDVDFDALVSPANSFGFMTGGIDAIYTNKFGTSLQEAVQKKLKQYYYGELCVGNAFEIRIPKTNKYLIVAPTMRIPMDITGTINAYLAMKAALDVVKRFNEVEEASARRENVPPSLIKTLLCPGLGTAIGKLPRNIAAFQMREAYRVVIENQPHDFNTLNDAYRYFEQLRRGV